jgi:hypothetical protein
MPLRRIAPALLVLAAAFAAPGAAVAAGPVVFTDPAEGSSAPDVTRMAVGNDSQTLTADVRFDNRPAGPTEQDVTTLYLDTDGQLGTGDPEHYGADAYVQSVNTSGLHAVLGKWVTGAWTTPVSAGVSAAWIAPDLRLRVALSDLGDPSGLVHLSLVAVWMGIIDYTDLAPDPPGNPFGYTIGAGTPPIAGDTTRPTTRITRGPSRLRTLHRATFRFTSNERGSTFMCRLDRRPWRSCSSPKTYRGLKKGRHVFRVYAKDKAGNRDLTPAIRRWRIV